MAKQKKKLSKEALRKLRQRIARKNFGLTKKSKSIKSTTKRSMAKKRKTTRTKTQKVFGINVQRALAAGIYGASRGRISNYLSPYTSKLPGGAISDEIGMYAALTLAKKYLFKGKSVLRDAATIGQDIEMARVGDAVISGEVNLGSLGNGGQTQSNPYGY